MGSDMQIAKNHQWPQFLAVFFAGFLSVGSGIQMGWASPSVPRLMAGELGFPISTEQASLIVTLGPLGYVIGSPLCGYLLDRIGRKYALLFLAPIQISLNIIIMFAKNVHYLYAARTMMGITDGGLYTVLPVYIGEIMEPKIRGVAGTSLSLGLLLGSLLINTYGSYLPVKLAACVSISAPLLFLTTFMWMPESPYYLLGKGDEKKARNALKSLRNVDNVGEELDGIKKAVERQMSEPGSLRDIFTIRSNLIGVVILTVLRTMQQLSGVFTVAFYMQTIFERANSLLPPHLSAIACNVMRIPLTFIGSLLIDKVGRKIMISISGIGTAFSLSVIATYFYFQYLNYDLEFIKWLPFTALIVYYIFSSMGIIVVPNLMMGELLPSNIKAKILGTMNIYFGLCMAGSSKMYQWTESSFGMHMPFYIYSACCVLGVIFVYFFVPETKGKTLEEIQEILKGESKKAKIEVPAPREIYTVIAGI